MRDLSDVTLPQLWIHRPVLERLLHLPARPWEVGGWLLGFWTADERAIFVTHATPPSGRGTPFGVKISGWGHRERFNQAWEQSRGHVTFLGDWHTHPGSVATPSQRDRRAITQLARDPDFGTPRPLTAIVQAPRWSRSKVRDVVQWHLAAAQPLGSTDELDARVVADLPAEAAPVPSWPWPSRR